MYVGTTSYRIDPSKIPYFQAYIRFNHSSNQELRHEDIPLFDIAYTGVEHGMRQCFRRLSGGPDEFTTLCETLQFLMVDVVQNRSIQDIMKDMRSGKDDYETEHRRSYKIKGDKSKARDAAFALLFLLSIGDFNSEVRDSQLMYQAVLFIVSHRAIFKYRTRKAVREAYEGRFQPSAKQLTNLNRWPILKPGEDGRGADDDVTTDPSSDDLDSDYDC
jgi:hypothetical protein